MYFYLQYIKACSEKKYPNTFQNLLYVFYNVSIKLLFYMPIFNDFKNNIMKIILK